ncbi:cysteine synthase A [mine drainage metagenome]|uniref:Cysteine synthase A n=1 Tax=mine drainage metagenome TaxID=410659 RepID=T1CQV5_9ZZZZ
MNTRFAGVSASILDAIGDTPLLEIEGIYAKLEFLNPSGSIKARIAKYMIARAEREGLLKPGGTIVEATSGNTGNALAMVAAVKGYRMLVVMPEGLSSERVAISRAYGAEVLFCGRFHVDDALAKARELGRQPGHFCPRQFDSEWNVEENRLVLGPEILAQLPAWPRAGRAGGRRRHRWHPDRRRPGISCGQSCNTSIRHGTRGIVHAVVRRNRPAPDRRHLGWIRAGHFPASCQHGR